MPCWFILGLFSTGTARFFSPKQLLVSPQNVLVHGFITDQVNYLSLQVFMKFWWDLFKWQHINLWTGLDKPWKPHHKVSDLGPWQAGNLPKQQIGLAAGSLGALQQGVSLCHHSLLPCGAAPRLKLSQAAWSNKRESYQFSSTRNSYFTWSNPCCIMSFQYFFSIFSFTRGFFFSSCYLNWVQYKR